MIKSTFVAALVVMVAMPALAARSFDAKPFPNPSQRGSLLVYSDVEVKYDADGALVMDTFIEMTNDSNDDVYVQLYFVNGDDPILDEVLSGTFPPILLERTHPGCNFVDAQIWLSPNKPTYWSSATGNNGGADSIQVPPYGNLDADPAAEGSADFIGDGRPDKDFPDLEQRTVRGFVLAWAVDVAGAEVTHNYLTGAGLKVDYNFGSAWEYDATAFQRIGDGPPDGKLFLNNAEYEAAPARLQMDFYSVMTDISSGDSGLTVYDTDLTILPMDIDLELDGNRNIRYTYIQADIWNQNEIRFSGAERCICCWDQTLLRHFQGMGVVGGNHFLRENIATDKGKARMTSLAGFNCYFDHLESTVTSTAEPLVGVAVKILQFGDDIALAGSTLTYQGYDDTGLIDWNMVEAAQELKDAELSIIEPNTKGLSRRPLAPVKNFRAISPR